jgi:hypothetical protein
LVGENQRYWCIAKSQLVDRVDRRFASESTDDSVVVCVMEAKTALDRSKNFLFVVSCQDYRAILAY